MGMEATGSPGLSAPGPRPIDVGGYRLALHEGGAGAPTVVLEAGGGCASAEWADILAAVARFTRAIRYDRAGLGASESAPGPRTHRDLVADLGVLLIHAVIPPPYVLVGHSLGGLIALHYTHQHPATVAGLVLVDAVHPAQDRCAAALLPPASPGDSARFRSMRAMLGGGYEPGRRLNPEGLRHDPQDAGVGASLRLGDRPLAVLTAMRHDPPPDLPADYVAAYEQMFQELQRDLARRSSTSRHILAERSGHAIHHDQPDLVIAAIRWAVDAARGRR